VIVATPFVTGDGDHPAGTSAPAEQIAMAAAECGVEAVVEEDPACAVARAAASAQAGLPVVVSGSFHLLAAVRPETTTR
jgi:dihydrofolate synthase/folylpolyglutamate synthase